MNRILITGANGLVGSQVTRRFAEANFEVFALCRLGSDLSLLAERRTADISIKIKVIEGDILDIASLEKALENDIDFVVHTAAVVSYSPKDRNNMYKVNVEVRPLQIMFADIDFEETAALKDSPLKHVGQHEEIANNGQLTRHALPPCGWSSWHARWVAFFHGFPCKK